MRNRPITRKLRAIISGLAALALCLEGWAQSEGLPRVCRLSKRCFGIIRELPTPLPVREVAGEVRVQSPFPEDPLPVATVEVFGPGDSTELHTTHTDEKGRFKIEGLAPGEYSLHVGASGFNSVIGKVIVSKQGPRKKIRIELTSGV